MGVCIPGRVNSVSKVGAEESTSSGEVRMSDLTVREKSLVALSAALASNCVPCIEFHLPGARRAGLSDAEISRTLRIADKVRQVPARAVLDAAQARIETTLDRSTETAGPGCGCGGSNAASEVGGVS